MSQGKKAAETLDNLKILFTFKFSNYECKDTKNDNPDNIQNEIM